MQSNITHTKVEYNGEFRRFTLDTLNYDHLQTLLRGLLSIESEKTFDTLFLDDEQDWVLISSDTELVYATTIAGSPLRLSVKLCDRAQEAQDEVQAPSHSFEVGESPVVAAISSFPFEERKAKKVAFVSAQIETLEEKLTKDIPAGKAAAIGAKLTVLRSKLERLNSEEPRVGKCKNQGRGPRTDFGNNARAEGRGGRGRGGCRGRGKWARPETSENPEDQMLFDRIQALKAELKIARQEKNQPEIEAKWQALQQAKAQRRAGKCGEKKTLHPRWEQLRQLKSEKRVCAMNLRKARTPAEIEECQLALEKAKEALEEFHTAFA